MTILHMPTKGAAPISIPPHIAICVPTVDSTVHFRFAQSLNMIHYFCGVKGIHLVSMNQNGSAIAKQRNLCIDWIEDEVETKQRVPISHVLFLDSDMVIPHYVVAALLAHDKDIVGASYVRRNAPFDVLGRTLNSETKDAKPIDTSDPSTPALVPMAAMPTGCLLIKRNVFRTLRRPYFFFAFKEESAPGKRDHREYGEDYGFCSKARAYGYQVWLDVELTKHIGHVSERVLFPEEDSYPDLKEAANVR
jgi:hypothetical protein